MTQDQMTIQSCRFIAYRQQRTGTWGRITQMRWWLDLSVMLILVGTFLVAHCLRTSAIIKGFSEESVLDHRLHGAEPVDQVMKPLA